MCYNESLCYKEGPCVIKRVYVSLSYLEVSFSLVSVQFNCPNLAFKITGLADILLQVHTGLHTIMRLYQNINLR